MSKILVMKGGHRFYTKKPLVLILKMMNQPFILVTLLSPHICLPSMEKMKLTMYMQIEMIMMKDN